MYAYIHIMYKHIYVCINMHTYRVNRIYRTNLFNIKCSTVTNSF